MYENGMKHLCRFFKVLWQDLRYCWRATDDKIRRFKK